MARCGEHPPVGRVHALLRALQILQKAFTIEQEQPGHSRQLIEPRRILDEPFESSGRKVGSHLACINKGMERHGVLRWRRQTLAQR